MSQAEIDIARRIYERWGKGDYSSAELLHPEFELAFAPGFLDEGVFKGQAEAWRGWRDWLDQWKTWTYDVRRFLDLGDGRVAVFIHMRAVAKTTEMELNFNTANLLEIEDGLARRVRLYAHAEDMMRELGLDAA
jgi:ketosteroid isomerase-like protein